MANNGFITIPKAINSLPGPVLFGTLVLLALIFAGLSSSLFSFLKQKLISIEAAPAICL